MLPPSSDRLICPISVRDDRGQSTNIRLGSTAPGWPPTTGRSMVSWGSAPRKCADTMVAAWNVGGFELSNSTPPEPGCVSNVAVPEYPSPVTSW